MARIKRVDVPRTAPLFNLGEVAENGIKSIPTLSLGLYARIVDAAIEEYQRVLQWLEPADMTRLLAQFSGVSWVRRRPFSLDVFVTKIEGRKITIQLLIDLFGSGGETEAFLNEVLKCLPRDSGIRVEAGALTATVWLPEEPTVVSWPDRRPVHVVDVTEAEHARQQAA